MKIISRGGLTIVRRKTRGVKPVRISRKNNLAEAVARGKNNIVIGEPLR